MYQVWVMTKFSPICEFGGVRRGYVHIVTTVSIPDDFQEHFHAFWTLRERSRVLWDDEHAPVALCPRSAVPVACDLSTS